MVVVITGMGGQCQEFVYVLPPMDGCPINHRNNCPANLWLNRAKAAHLFQGQLPNHMSTDVEG